MGWGGSNASDDLHKGITTPEAQTLAETAPRKTPTGRVVLPTQRQRLQGMPPMDGATAPYLQLRKRNFSLTLSLADASVRIWGGGFTTPSRMSPSGVSDIGNDEEVIPVQSIQTHEKKLARSQKGKQIRARAAPPAPTNLHISGPRLPSSLPPRKADGVLCRTNAKLSSGIFPASVVGTPKSRLGRQGRQAPRETLVFDATTISRRQGRAISTRALQGFMADLRGTKTSTSPSTSLVPFGPISRGRSFFGPGRWVRRKQMGSRMRNEATDNKHLVPISARPRK